MDAFNLDQLVTIIRALRLYQDNLKTKLESMTDDDEYYGITVGEMVVFKDLLQEVEQMHEKLYTEKFGHEA